VVPLLRREVIGNYEEWFEGLAPAAVRRVPLALEAADNRNASQVDDQMRTRRA